MTRVVLHIDNDDLPEVLQQVVFALKEHWGERLTHDWLKRVEASQS